MRVFAFIFLASIGTAQNSLRLTGSGSLLFKVSLAGKPLTINAQASVLVDQLMQDTVKLRLEFENGQSFETTFFLLDQGRKTVNMEYNYIVEPLKQGVKTTFTGMYNQVALPNPLVPKKPVPDTSGKYNNIVLEHFCELNNGVPTYFNNLPKDNKCLQPMPDTYMSYTNLLMKKARSDEAKYNIAESVCRNNCITVKQLNMLLGYIDFEIEKLRLVKLGYFSLTDTSNRKGLEKSFRFESTVTELNNFFIHSAGYRIKSGDHCTKPSDTSETSKFRLHLEILKNDSERYNLFKKNYEDFCYTVKTIRLILQTFIHDREKLNAAELMYFYCVEKESYSKLEDVFSYKETINALKNFVSKQKR